MSEFGWLPRLISDEERSEIRQLLSNAGVMDVDDYLAAYERGVHSAGDYVHNLRLHAAESGGVR